MKIFVGLAFMLISSTAFAATSEKFGKGGWYKDFHPEIERANASGALFRIKGHCQSLCTMFLGLRNVCVERGYCFMPATTVSAISTQVRRSAC